MRVAFLADPGDGLLERLGAELVPDPSAARAHDVAVATTWREARALAGADGPGAAAWLIEVMEDRLLAPGSPEARDAQEAYRLPLTPIARARWIADQLEQLDPGRRVLYLRPGVDKAAFAAPEQPRAGDGPLRVLVEGDPSAPAALAATAGMREPRHLTFLGTPPEGAAVDAVRDPAGRAAVYAETDVVVRVPRVDRAPRALIEAFHLGATAVTTPVTGHDEYVADGVNALLTSWDDDRGTARLLDLLARDRALLQRLRAAALQTARAWPSLEDAAAELRAALHALHPVEGRATRG